MLRQMRHRLSCVQLVLGYANYPKRAEPDKIVNLAPLIGPPRDRALYAATAPIEHPEDDKASASLNTRNFPMVSEQREPFGAIIRARVQKQISLVLC